MNQSNEIISDSLDPADTSLEDELSKEIAAAWLELAPKSKQASAVVGALPDVEKLGQQSLVAEIDFFQRLIAILEEGMAMMQEEKMENYFKSMRSYAGKEIGKREGKMDLKDRL